MNAVTMMLDCCYSRGWYGDGDWLPWWCEHLLSVWWRHTASSKSWC